MDEERLALNGVTMSLNASTGFAFKNGYLGSNQAPTDSGVGLGTASSGAA